MKPTKVTGRLWLITDRDGKLIDNIDTDMIFHNAHLHITDVAKMGEHAFGNLENWEHFPTEAKPGDVVMVGKNFGAGSSRQQAVDCFAALGISVIVAESFGAIYKRNAINSGMPIIASPELTNNVPFHHLEEITVDFETGFMESESGSFRAHPMTEIQAKIFQAGSLFAYGKELV